MFKEMSIKGQPTLVKMTNEEMLKIAKESLEVAKSDKYGRVTKEEIEMLEATIKELS